MSDLKFDPSLSPEENISRFFDHLRTVDEGLAAILEEEIHAMIPLPESSGRARVREAFYRAVKPRIEPKVTGTGESKS